MKTQLKVQKILMLVTLIVSALVLVYALFFMTGGLGDVYNYLDESNNFDAIHCADFVHQSQNFVSTLVAFGIVLIVLVAVMYLMGCQSRRKYYITNYIAIGLFVVFALVVAFYLIAMVANIMNLYRNGIHWTRTGTSEDLFVTRIIIKYDDNGMPIGSVTQTAYNNYAEQAQYFPSYPLNPNQMYNFILGFVMFVILFIDIACVVLCTVWKVALMKGEDKLLAQGAPAEQVNASEEVSADEAVVTEAVAAEAVAGANPVKEE